MLRRELFVSGAFVVASVLWAGAAAAAPGADVVEASKTENHLLIYSNMDSEQWRPVVEGFNRLYPWIKVETLSMGASESISRYEAETGTGNSSADFIVTGSIADWIRFAEKKLGADYESSESANLPEWSKPFPGVYTFSTDPMVLGYSKLLLSEEQQPDSFEGFAKVISENPSLFKGKVGTYGVDGFGGSINWAFVRQHGDQAWQWLDTIGSSVRSGDGSGTMIEKLSRGEYTAVYFLSGPVVMPKMEGGLQQVISWKYISDGTPVFLRGMAVTGKAKNMNSAKLMLDYILSVDGQVSVSKAGFTPYRDGLPEDQLRFGSLEQLKKKIGEKNIIFINYDQSMLTGFDDFTKRWNKAMGK